MSIETAAIQAAYAANLSGRQHGTALYKPIVRDSHSGIVGDVAFFDSHGKYKWLQNAFFTEV